MTKGYEEFRQEARGGKHKKKRSLACHTFSACVVCSPLEKQSNIVITSYTATFRMIW